MMEMSGLLAYSASRGHTGYTIAAGDAKTLHVQHWKSMIRKRRENGEKLIIKGTTLKVASKQTSVDIL